MCNFTADQIQLPLVLIIYNGCDAVLKGWFVIAIHWSALYET